MSTGRQNLPNKVQNLPNTKLTLNKVPKTLKISQNWKSKYTGLLRHLFLRKFPKHLKATFSQILLCLQQSFARGLISGLVRAKGKWASTIIANLIDRLLPLRMKSPSSLIQVKTYLGKKFTSSYFFLYCWFNVGTPTYRLPYIYTVHNVYTITYIHTHERRKVGRYIGVRVYNLLKRSVFADGNIIFLAPTLYPQTTNRLRR